MSIHRADPLAGLNLAGLSKMLGREHLEPREINDSHPTRGYLQLLGEKIDDYNKIVTFRKVTREKTPTVWLDRRRQGHIYGKRGGSLGIPSFGNSNMESFRRSGIPTSEDKSKSPPPSSYDRRFVQQAIERLADISMEASRLTADQPWQALQREYQLTEESVAVAPEFSTLQTARSNTTKTQVKRSVHISAPRTHAHTQAKPSPVPKTPFRLMTATGPAKLEESSINPPGTAGTSSHLPSISRVKRMKMPRRKKRDPEADGDGHVVNADGAIELDPEQRAYIQTFATHKMESIFGVKPGVFKKWNYQNVRSLCNRKPNPTTSEYGRDEVEVKLHTQEILDNAEVFFTELDGIVKCYHTEPNA